MILVKNLNLPFDHSESDLEREILQRLGIRAAEMRSYRLQRSSLDARKGRPLRRVYSVVVEVIDEEVLRERMAGDGNLSTWEPVSYTVPVLVQPIRRARPLVVGTGPAGIFAGLILAEAGLDPILLERGREVQRRTQDVGRFWSSGILDRESNVQFGEGGAGTFSDGKLGSRIKDKFGRREKILQEMVEAGAPQAILVEHKPHVGTANLVSVVQGLRRKIQLLGGEYRFESRLTDLVLEQSQLRGVRLESGEEILCSHLVLAVGHSARDTFERLGELGVALAAKPFSMGLRVEHLQSLIDRNQYGKSAGHPSLSAADYQLSYHTQGGRTVYSFCMCPGGYVIGAASEEGGLVTNGMSQFDRGGRNANSALVAEVFPEDFGMDPLGGFALQRYWERAAYQLGGGGYVAPVQRLGDFLVDQATNSFGEVQPTYRPGVEFANLRELLPRYVLEALLEAIPIFDKKIKGFAGHDAILTGVETRTSCPLRILRGKDFQSTTVRGLFPAGEGSGYAGGIMSSAVDGIKAAEAVLQDISRA